MTIGLIQAEFTEKDLIHRPDIMLKLLRDYHVLAAKNKTWAPLTPLDREQMKHWTLVVCQSLPDANGECSYTIQMTKPELLKICEDRGIKNAGS